MLLPLFHKDLADVLFVSPFAVSNDFLCDLRIFWEQVVLQESFAESNALDGLHGNEDKFRLLVGANIVIAYKCARFLLDTKLELLG